MPSAANGPQCKATVKFSTTEQARRAIAKINGRTLLLLGVSKIWLSHMFRAKLSTMTSMYTTISLQTANVQQGLRFPDYLEIKSYPSTGKVQQFTILYIVSNTAQVAGRAKAAVEKISSDHTARGGKDIVWHEVFLKPVGMKCLKALWKEHIVFIYRNPIKCILSLYGDKNDEAAVESALIKTIDFLAASTINIELDDGVSFSVYQVLYQIIVRKLGKTGAQFNVTTSPR